MFTCAVPAHSTSSLPSPFMSTSNQEGPLETEKTKLKVNALGRILLKKVISMLLVK
jgi:hypothetical protein